MKRKLSRPSKATTAKAATSKAIPAKATPAKATNDVAAPNNVTPLKAPQKKDEAFAALERMIVNGELEPGQKVSETDLIELSGHTRASVRSAVQRLSDHGLLKIIPRSGAQVCTIDYEQHFRSLELRRAVETLVAKSAAKRATPEQKRKFKAILKKLTPSGKLPSQQQLTDLDAASFSLMLETANNEFAARALSSVKGLSRRFWVLHRDEYGDVEKMVSAHARIAAAIADGDEDEAEAAVHNLIDYVEQFTLEVVGYTKFSKSAG